MPPPHNSHFVRCLTDYDCWRLEEEHEPVTVEMIIENLNKNTDIAKKIIKGVLKKIGGKRECVCKDALKDAIITSRDAIPSKKKKELEIIIGKYL